jgi:hypothetical protein
MNGRHCCVGIFGLACVAASYWSVMNSWNGRWLLTRSPGVVKDALREARLLNQNEVFPGCGNGRENAARAGGFAERIAESDPVVVRPNLTDHDATVRAAAVLVLGRARDRSSIPKRITLLRNDESPKVKAAAAGALNYFKSKEIDLELAPLTQSSDRLTRVCAYYAMSTPPASKAVAWLNELEIDLGTSDSDLIASRMSRRVLAKR